MPIAEKQQQQPLVDEPGMGSVGAKTARACDSCLKNRARWYCAADDAFLCQSCDSAVHSANSLARRHERLRLKTSSSSYIFKSPLSITVEDAKDDRPAWHHGFKRKARTPRGGGVKAATSIIKGGLVSAGVMVPELETTSSSEEEYTVTEGEELLYRVPVFDPMLAEFSSSPESSDDVKPLPMTDEDQLAHAKMHAEGLSGFLSTGIDVGEFEIDMENLLGQGFEEESFCMKGLGFTDSLESDFNGGRGATCLVEGNHGTVVKEEEEEEDMYLDNDSVGVDFDCGSPWTRGDASEEENKMINAMTTETRKRKIMLSLDYEAVRDAWSTQGSPWTNGQRPKLDSDDALSDDMGMMWVGGELQGGVCGTRGCGSTLHGSGDKEREARVSRYREKRRKRLFSKKIRYEVRKLNAEKRPRMKGRFVKRTTFITSTTTTILAAAQGVVAPQFVF